MPNGTVLIALSADERAFLARRFACRNPERMRWAAIAANHYQCDGCGGHCGTSDLNCGSAQVQGELNFVENNS